MHHPLTHHSRTPHAGAIESWCSQRTLPEVVVAMKAARVPSGPILSMQDILSEPQFVQRGMIQTAPVLATATAGEPPPLADGEAALAEAAGQLLLRSFTVPAMLPVLSKTPGSTRWAGPELGQHTDRILKGELGLDDATLHRLRDSGAI